MDMAGWKTRAKFKPYAITNSSDTTDAVRKLEQARAENSHNFGHATVTATSGEAETRKGMDK